MYKSVAIFLSSTLLVACSSSAPIVDTKGVNTQTYQADLQDCEAYADQVTIADKAVTRAATGAVVAGAVGAIFDGSEGARHGAGAGAVVGATRGASEGYYEKDRVVRNCLRGRGYRVLS